MGLLRERAVPRLRRIPLAVNGSLFTVGDSVENRLGSLQSPEKGALRYYLEVPVVSPAVPC